MPLTIRSGRADRKTVIMRDGLTDSDKYEPGLARLRNKWRILALAVVLGAVLLIPFIKHGDELGPGAVICGFQFALLLLLAYLNVALAHCPRCGNTCYLKGWKFCIRRSCWHCGFRLKSA